MVKNEQLITESTNLSLAWFQAAAKVAEPGIQDIAPLIVNVTGICNGVVEESDSIRDGLDNELVRGGKQSIETVASTIFPQSLWNPEMSASALYSRFDNLWPNIKKYNKRGHYFRRMVHYLPKGCKDEPINQLDHIIQTYQSGVHRRSALQLSIFDPTRDHTQSRQQGFPCLQQVAFAPEGKDGLCVTGFYATQYLFERAYGNYLGLCRLGRYVAYELGLNLTRMMCISNVAIKDSISKKRLRHLLNNIFDLGNEFMAAA